MFIWILTSCFTLEVTLITQGSSLYKIIWNAVMDAVSVYNKPHVLACGLWRPRRKNTLTTRTCKGHVNITPDFLTWGSNPGPSCPEVATCLTT